MDPRLAEELLARLRRDGALIAARFELRYRVIESERPRVRRRYGVCYSDGTIRIRLRHAVTGEPLRYSSLVNTLCHELAHLRHFDHGLRFRRFYAQLLEFARDRGVYQPRTPELAARRAVAPRRAPGGAAGQLSLFGDAGPVARRGATGGRAGPRPRGREGRAGG